LKHLADELRPHCLPQTFCSLPVFALVLQSGYCGSPGPVAPWSGKSHRGTGRLGPLIGYRRYVAGAGEAQNEEAKVKRQAHTPQTTAIAKLAIRCLPAQDLDLDTYYVWTCRRSFMYCINNSRIIVLCRVLRGFTYPLFSHVIKRHTLERTMAEAFSLSARVDIVGKTGRYHVNR
jgi:hypothetical protein